MCALDVWMTTHCHERTGKVSDRPTKLCVNNTFITGRNVNTITFEMVARARMVRSDSEWFGYCAERLSGSKVQTSPRLPLNMHLEL